MTTLDNCCPQIVPPIGPATLVPFRQEPPCPISREVAHELNNILTIIQGYADQMILKHGDNPALRPQMQLIADNARRAVSVVQKASARRPAAGVLAR